jgi:hypothetical protein
LLGVGQNRQLGQQPLRRFRNVRSRLQPQCCW